MAQVDVHPLVFINGQLVPVTKTPKFLGVIFSSSLSSSPHMTDVIARVARRISILKALAGTSWGFHRETMLITYKTLILSIINYACPIWYPNASSSAIQRLQRLQNTALRICTGNVKKAAIAHLHAEAGIMQVDDHLCMLCLQFFANTMQPSHPSHAIVNLPRGP